MAVGFRDTHLSSPVYTDPEAFDPSRWDSLPNLEKQEGDCSIDRMNYTPFGAGVRFCVGKEYAKLIIRIFLIELTRKCDWKIFTKRAMNLDYKYMKFKKPYITALL